MGCGASRSHEVTPEAEPESARSHPRLDVKEASHGAAARSPAAAPAVPETPSDQVTPTESDHGEFVCDCGSGHTSIFLLACGADGYWRGKSDGLSDPDRKIVMPDQNNPHSLKVALARDVLSRPAEQLEFAVQVFVESFCATLKTLGDDGQARVFIGATGGVRKALNKPGAEGLKCRAAFAKVGAALEQALGTRVEIRELNGTAEAEYEASAAYAACDAIFRDAGRGVVAIAAAGGATCQFVHPLLPKAGGRVSVHADIYERVTAIRNASQESMEALRGAAKCVLEEYAVAFAEAELPTMPDGTWAGLTLFADFAELGGFLEEFISVPELKARIEALVEEVLQQKGSHPRCLAKWPYPARKEGEQTQAQKNWPIGVATGLRLRAFLEYFSDASSFYFIQRLPPPPVIEAGGQTAQALNLDWPIGRAVASRSARPQYSKEGLGGVHAL